MTLLLDHLWQSTLIAVLVGLLTLGLGRNGAAIRFWLWFAASMKFLVPFSVLAEAGRRLAVLYPLPATLAPLANARPTAEMMLVPARSLIPAAVPMAGLFAWLAALWLTGILVLLFVRVARWRRLCRILRTARPVRNHGPLTVRLSATTMEPGLVGILKPVVLLPAGLDAHMAVNEMDAVLAHEAAHHRRRDNLTAALQMLVEVLFWFWPVVWLIGARMIAERERACDERVLAEGHDPHIYAGAILKVCRFCVRAPLACVSGAAGARLAGRVERIMMAEMPDRLGPVKSTMLVGLGAMLLASPLATGLEPVAHEIRLQAAAVQDGIRVVAARMSAVPLSAAPAALKVTATPHLHRPAVAPLPVVPSLPPAPVPATAQKAIVADQPARAKKVAPLPLAPEAKLALALAHARMALMPSGEGDPDAVTCRVPQYLPASRFRGPKICKVNRIWALLRARALDYSADGRELVSTAGGFVPRAAVRPG